jgi:hypothetical protein
LQPDILNTARANRAYSLSILNNGEDTSEAELNRAAVAAFYAAMHAINAYLWEIARLEPSSHRDRRAIIGQWPTLNTLEPSYAALFNRSLLARYEPGYSVRMTQLTSHINRHLAHIVTTIARELQGDE